MDGNWAVVKAWTSDLAQACEGRYESANAEDRKRLVWLLESAKTKSAYDVLLRRLPRACENEAAQILRVLSGAGIVVPTDQIHRLFKDASQEAVVAAGISGDVTLAPRLAELLDTQGLGRHAALALAMLGKRESVVCSGR